jgi:hypothetical protein
MINRKNKNLIANSKLKKKVGINMEIRVNLKINEHRFM